MSTVIPLESERTDPEGHPLVAAKPHDAFRHKQVWAVYRFRPASRNADIRCSEFVSVAMAKGAADELNRTRPAGTAHYFRVYRLAANSLESKSNESPPGDEQDFRRPRQRS